MGQILLVRHGQADRNGDDYDRLVEHGWAQCRALGVALAKRGITPERVVRGSMRRHRESAEAALEAYAAAPEVAVDPGWNEFDHVAMLKQVPADFGGRTPDAREFQAWFERGAARWTGGKHDEDYAEPFPAFTARVEGALAAVSGAKTSVVFTSGGAIGWVAASLLGRDLAPADRVGLWRRLNNVCANTGITRVVAGRSGLSLVGFNELAHLDGTDLLTYR